MAEPLAPLAERQTWSLATLAEEAGFDAHIEVVTGAIADRFALKIHQNLVARRMAFIAWIDGVVPTDRTVIDHRSFVTICAALIGGLARHRAISYSAMIRDPADEMIAVILNYPNEITALAAGAALYELRVGALIGMPAGEPLPPLVVENAAANLARHPEAATRFRELLRLGTPWT